MFEEEYVRQVIGPKLLPVCASAASIKEACTAFSKAYGYNISAKKLTHWLFLLGIRPEKKVLFVGLSLPQQVELPEIEEPLSPPVPTRFPSQLDIAPPMGIFTNVPMPGFSE
jgi:hypothetical protein